MRVKKAVPPGKENACVECPFQNLPSSYENIKSLYEKVIKKKPTATVLPTYWNEKENRLFKNLKRKQQHPNDHVSWSTEGSKGQIIQRCSSDLEIM